jgi:hypothetical protein
MLAISRMDIAPFRNFSSRHFLLITSKKAYELGIELKNNQNPVQAEKASIMVVNHVDINPILATGIAHNTDILYIPYGFDDCHFPTIKNLNKQSRLITLLTRDNQCPSHPELLKDNLQRLNNMDVEHHIRLGDDYLSKLSTCTYLDFIDSQLQLHARLECNADYVSSKFYGFNALGEETFGPRGEVSITPRAGSRENSKHPAVYESPPIIQLNGNITLHGYCVLNRQCPVRYAPNNIMQNLFSRLDTLRQGRLNIQFKHGVVVHMEVIDKAAQPAYELLDALFTTDARYQSLFEIGYGLDLQNPIADGNNLANDSPYARGSLTSHIF